MAPVPKKENVDTAVTTTQSKDEHASDLLLKHCLALSAVDETRPSAKLRLEEAVGPELARRLLVSLSQSTRR
jgi:hypothetical protein